jgi:hypothetical protein
LEKKGSLSSKANITIFISLNLRGGLRVPSFLLIIGRGLTLPTGGIPTSKRSNFRATCQHEAADLSQGRWRLRFTERVDCPPFTVVYFMLGIIFYEGV